MKILKGKYHWDGFIYGLVYPGFVGSMIYELIPATTTDAKLEYFTMSTYIKIIITLFYCVDYLHLYGDMHPKVDREIRSWKYLLCDFATSLVFFFAFVLVKLEYYKSALFLIALIPLFFTIYKFKNVKDKYFHGIYLALSIITAIICLFCLNSIWSTNCITNPIPTLFWFSLISFAIYCFYVFYYYNKYSNELDVELYKTSKTK